jgi:malate dehydrogenase
MPSVAMLEGEYGQQDIAMGVPCILTHNGLSRL